MESLTPYLYKEVLAKVSIKDNSPEILEDIFSFVYKVSPPTTDYLRNNLEFINLSDYKGDHAKEIFRSIKKICNILQGDGYWERNLIMSILNVFKWFKYR